MTLEKLMDKPKKKNLYIITIIALMATIIIALAMQPIETALKGNTGFGVMEFEFAWTTEMINTIFNAWGQAGMLNEAINTYIDFAFIPSYVLLSACLLLIAARRLNATLQKICLIMVITPFIAGILDVIENINLLLMINDPAFILSSSPFIASICATFKFGILIIDILFFIVAIILEFLKKDK